MRIIIAGAGAVGRHLAKLLSHEDMDISLIDERQDRLGDLDANYDLLTKIGSPTSIHDLKNINVKDVDLFIAVTPSESDNITACLLANQLGAKKTLARIDNYEYLIPENKRIFELMGLNHLIYPELLAAQEITASLKTNWMRYHITLCNGALELCVVKVRTGAEVIGKKFISGFFNHGLYRVVAIKRGQETIIPGGQDEIYPDDTVYAVCTRENMKILREQMGKQKREIKNIIFFGGSKITQKTVQNLPDDLSIKILEADRELCYNLSEKISNALIINADGSDMAVLKEEGIEDADAFVAVTDSSGTDIHDNSLRIDIQALQHDIQLLGQIDVVGSLCAHLLAVGQGHRGADSLVVFVLGGHHQNVSAQQSLGDLGEQLVVLFKVLAAQNHQRQVRSFGNSFGIGDAVGNASVCAVGVGRLKMQGDEVSAFHGGSFGSPLCHGGATGIEVHKAGSCPALGGVGDLDTDLGRMFDLTVEGVERQHILTADDDCLVTGAQSHGIDLAAEGSRLRSESHKLISPLKNN